MKAAMMVIAICLTIASMIASTSLILSSCAPKPQVQIAQVENKAKNGYEVVHLSITGQIMAGWVTLDRPTYDGPSIHFVDILTGKEVILFNATVVVLERK